jgi:hypothetical protein
LPWHDFFFLIFLFIFYEVYLLFLLLLTFHFKIKKVLSSMVAWKDISLLAHFVERHVQSPERDNLFMPPGMGGMIAPMLPEDDHSLQESITALQHLTSYVQNDAQLYHFVDEILRNAREIETCSRTMRDEQLFDKLQPLRMRLLWAPIHLVQTVDHTNANFLTVAHLYGTAMAIDVSLPELNGAAFGALTTAPLLEIDRKLRYTSPPTYDPITGIEEMMMFPRQISGRIRLARGSFDNGLESLNPGHGSPYSFQNLHLDSGPTTPAFPPSFPTFMPNISAEDLNLSVPPSPFLNSFVSQGSKRHSGLLENHSRPTSMNFDRRSFSGFSSIGPGGESPSYSPAAHSPVPSAYLEDDQSLYGEHVGSWGHPTG